jgi:hypothetical protein
LKKVYSQQKSTNHQKERPENAFGYHMKNNNRIIADKRGKQSPRFRSTQKYREIKIADSIIADEVSARKTEIKKPAITGLCEVAHNRGLSPPKGGIKTPRF